MYPGQGGTTAGRARELAHAGRRAERRAMLAERVLRRRIINGHGDLRPEHIWFDHEVRIIDCLEFNPRLRAVDPFDEITFLDVECERLGAARTLPGASRAASMTMCRPSCIVSIPAIAPRCAPASPSLIFLTRIPERPRNGPASRAPISTSARAMLLRLELLLRTRRGR
jgi:hypothetical protein